ncbi:hypothetical protein [Amycolatopsis sp. NPDC051102]|uniref:hypothetical protein n=1 Tax=Amycolatopsis sp. NPDC051102 TaxID=3155163 RepID=UPI00344689D9
MADGNRAGGASANTIQMIEADTEILGTLLQGDGFAFKRYPFSGAAYLEHRQSGVTVRPHSLGYRISYPATHAPLHLGKADLTRDTSHHVVSDFASAIVRLINGNTAPSSQTEPAE